MSLPLRRCALPLVAALVLLGSAACDDAAHTTSRLANTSVDSSNTRAHRLANLVARADTLSTLTRALRQAGLLRELRRGGPYTLFAPTDRAFQRYLPGFDSLLAPAGTSATASLQGPPGGAAQMGNQGGTSPGGAAAPARDSLRRVLQFHLVRGRFDASALGDSLRLGTLTGGSFLLERAPQRPGRGLRVRVEGTPRPAPIRRTMRAQNGVLHVLARPLRIPPPDTSAQGALGDTTAAADNGAPNTN